MKLIPTIFLSASILFAVYSNAQTTTQSKTTTVAKTVTPAKTTTVVKASSTAAKTVAKKKTTKKVVAKVTAPSAVKTAAPTSAQTPVTTKTVTSTKPVAGNTTTILTPTSSSTTTTTTTTQTTSTSTGKPTMGNGTTTSGTTTTDKPTSTTTGTGKPNMGNGTTGTITTTTTTTGGNIITDVLGGGTGDITQLDAASAIKDALSKGITEGVNKVSVTNGYFGNSFIKIPFPKDVAIVESTLRSFGMGSMVDNLVLSLNRAAESAASQAAPIFLGSIKQMTITDAINIVSNQQPDAATQFLQRTTTESLVGAFKPSIKGALDKTLATKYWSDITGYYNQIPFVSPVNSDLPDYVTRKAITGLFYMIGQEEAKIRKDPVGTGSAIVDKVFGAFKKK